MTRDDKINRTILGLTPEQVQWFTPFCYKDGRQRAQLLGRPVAPINFYSSSICPRMSLMPGVTS